MGGLFLSNYNVTGGYTPVFECSISYSTEYSDSKLLDRAALVTACVFVDPSV